VNVSESCCSLDLTDGEQHPVAHPEVALPEPPLDVGRLGAHHRGRYPVLVSARGGHPDEAPQSLFQVRPPLGQAVGGRRRRSRLRFAPGETAQREDAEGERHRNE